MLWRRVIPLLLVVLALVAGVFSGTIGRQPPPPHPCADRLLPPKYYMRDCVVRVAAVPPLSELNDDYHWWTAVYIFEKYPDLCRPSLNYSVDELFFIFYTECERRFDVANDVLHYMKKRDKTYPYTDIDYNFIARNNRITAKDGITVYYYGEWIPDVPDQPQENGRLWE